MKLNYCYDDFMGQFTQWSLANGHDIKDLGQDQKPYKIELSINKFKNKKCSEMFPQYELKIFSEAAYEFQNQLKFVYKKRFHYRA